MIWWSSDVQKVKQVLRGAIRTFGFDIVRLRSKSDNSQQWSDLSPEDRAILRSITGFTMTSPERQIALIQAVRYLVRQQVYGCFVECGVWRGGSSMAIALALLQEQATDRDLFLFDTYEGMTSPTDVDRTTDGTLARTHLDRDVEKKSVWCVADIDDVRANMASTGYPTNHVHLIQGPVEKTIPQRAPEQPIALLRLDTDWYESTKHELTHLFPRVRAGGVVIIDDYGHWEGARRAVDEYLGQFAGKYFLHRIDYTGRLLVKQKE